MEKDQTHEILVHTDRRACVTAPILHAFAEASGLKKLPKKIYATRNENGFVLRWKQSDDAKSYDLSDRDRVLVGGYRSGQRMVVIIKSDALVVEGKSKTKSAVAPKAKKPKSPRKAAPAKTPFETFGFDEGQASEKKPRPWKASTRKPRPKKATESNFLTVMKAGICADLVENFTDLPLSDAAQVLDKYLPGVTVGDLAHAEGSAMPLFGMLLDEAGGARTKSSKPVASRPARKAPQSATNGHASPSLLQSIKTAGDAGMSVHDLMTVTSLPLRETRNAVKRLIDAGSVARRGNTRAARYIATA